MVGEPPSTIGLSKYIKIKSLSPLPFPEKTGSLFAIFGLFLPGNRVGSKIKVLESKCKFVKKCLFKHFPVLQLYKGHFRNILTGFLSLAAYPMQNLMLNRLTPISNPKNEKAKSSYILFLLTFFILRPLQLTKDFSYFPDHFGQLTGFFQVSLKQKH